jgi:hypothetical protein
MKTPATARIPAPKSLVGATTVPKDLADDFAAPGYAVAISGDELVVTRTGTANLPGDPDALPALIDQPFEEQEIANLRGLAAMHEARAE